MAGFALHIGADESAKSRLLPAIARGEKIATLVLDSLAHPDELGQLLIADEGNLNGSAALVVDAVNASQLLVIASEGVALQLYEVELPADGVTITPKESLDATPSAGSST